MIKMLLFFSVCNVSGLTSSVSLTQVREPPNIADPDAESHTGEDVLGFVVPLGSVFGLLFFLSLQFLMAWDPQIESWVRKHPPHDVHMCTGVELPQSFAKIPFLNCVYDVLVNLLQSIDQPVQTLNLSHNRPPSLSTRTDGSISCKRLQPCLGFVFLLVVHVCDKIYIYIYWILIS